MAAGARVTATTSATALNSVQADPVMLVVRNRDASASVDLGGSGVTTGNGYELAAGQTEVIPLEPGEILYAITASGTVRVDTLIAG